MKYVLTGPNWLRKYGLWLGALMSLSGVAQIVVLVWSLGAARQAPNVYLLMLGGFSLIVLVIGGIAMKACWNRTSTQGD